MSEPQTTDTIEQAIILLRTIMEREAEYEKLNKQIFELQGDFHSHVAMIDGAIHHKIYKLLEAIFNCDVAEYFMLEARNMKNGGAIYTPDGKTWPICNLNDVRSYVEGLKQ